MLAVRPSSAALELALDELPRTFDEAA